jgi:hypothetical protein
MGGGLLGIGGRSEGPPAPRSGRGPLDTPEPVSVGDVIPGSLAMSGDGAEGAGSMVKVGPEGSGSFDTTGGDASAFAPSPTRFSPTPPTMAAPAASCLVLMADPRLKIAVHGDR